jgi:glycosyltransferase involved in cell wall biosynthesis
MAIYDKGLGSVPPGMDVLGVLTHGYNCVVDKLMGELAPFMEPYKIGITIADASNPYAPMEYIPKWVWYERIGTVPTDNIGLLATMEQFINQYQIMGIPVFYHIDDALFFINDKAPLKYLDKCDKTVVSSLALAEYLLINHNYKKPVYILKTHVDLNMFDLIDIPEYLIKKDMFNILFTSQGRIGSLMFRRIVERMNQNPEKYKNVNLISVTAGVAQIRSIINEFRNVKKSYYEWMNVREFYGLVKGCQLIIAPGEVGDLDYIVSADMQPLWLDAKSCVKYTLAGAARIPCIASPMREYALAIKNGVNGLIAENIDEWMDCIDNLLTNANLREDIGREARADVEMNWEARIRAKQLVDILREEGDECLCVLAPEEKEEVKETS